MDSRSNSVGTFFQRYVCENEEIVVLTLNWVLMTLDGKTNTHQVKERGGSGMLVKVRE